MTFYILLPALPILMCGKYNGNPLAAHFFSCPQSNSPINPLRKFTDAGVNFLCMASLLISILYTWLRSAVRSGKLVCAMSFSLKSKVFTKQDGGTFPFLVMNIVALAMRSTVSSERLFSIRKERSFLCCFINRF